MEAPKLADFVHLFYTQWQRFIQACPSADSALARYDYPPQVLTLFFLLMQARRIHTFQAQHRWLQQHPDLRHALGFVDVPNRTTLSRRYKRLYPLLQAFVTFTGQDAQPLDEALASRHLYEDKSLFKAAGPVWHSSDRQAGVIPKGLRHLDTDATWSKSGYHGWVYGYGLSLTCNRVGFPKLVQVETASVSESQVMACKTDAFLTHLRPDTVIGDNGYTQAARIRQFAQAGVVLLTPASKWTTGRFARAYRRFRSQPQEARLLKARRSAIEPMFDLCAKWLGTTHNHKQLPVQRLPNVQTCLTLAVVALQLAMLVNAIWSLPLRALHPIQTAFT